MTLMCSAPVIFDTIKRSHGVDFQAHFASEMAMLEQYEDAGLIAIDATAIRVTAKGRLFVRAIAMVFDKYLARPSESTYSKLI